MGFFFSRRDAEAKGTKAPDQPEILKQVRIVTTTQALRSKSDQMLTGIPWRRCVPIPIWTARDTTTSIKGLRAGAPGFHARAHEHRGRGQAPLSCNEALHCDPADKIGRASRRVQHC